jgi:hypothetical protein
MTQPPSVENYWCKIEATSPRDPLIAQLAWSEGLAPVTSSARPASLATLDDRE